MDADSSNQYQVTKNEVWEYSPCFSPDGKKLIFTRSTDYSHAPNAQIHFKIYTIDIDGSNERYLTDGAMAKKIVLIIRLRRLSQETKPNIISIASIIINDSITWMVNINPQRASRPQAQV